MALQSFFSIRVFSFSRISHLCDPARIDPSPKTRFLTSPSPLASSTTFLPPFSGQHPTTSNPLEKATSYSIEAWRRDIAALTKARFADLSKLFARKKGSAEAADANDAADRIERGDLVFIDPPYSGLHYSRFYHVLESIACGEPGMVSGTGRYPDPSLRPRSRYSIKSESREALADLLAKIAPKGARVIVTFPAHECSNGLSGGIVRELSRQHFRVAEKAVRSKFSTLGGTSDDGEKGRAARQSARELILSLTPR